MYSQTKCWRQNLYAETSIQIRNTSVKRKKKNYFQKMNIESKFNEVGVANDEPRIQMLTRHSNTEATMPKLKLYATC